MNERPTNLFQHAVASGDPLTDRVIIWTRATTDGNEPVSLDWTMSRDPDLRDVVATGTVTAEPDADFTAKADVGGLDPDTHYFYAFESGGERSPVGRTRTLPDRTDHLRFAMVSCAKYNAGFFNAYRRIAERDELNFLLHLGDYIYEASQNPPATQTKSKDIGRPFEPLDECRTLEAYRTRYAQYRRDPDVQAVHLRHPFIGTVDDHEFADGAWRGGATEHKPERDGPWEDRMAAAFRARWEWLPYRMPEPSNPARVWHSFDVGGLAEVFMIDTRSRRDDPERPGAMSDPNHSQLGPEQAEWLLHGLRESPARWRLLGNGSCMTHLWKEGLPELSKPGILALKLTNPECTGPDPDQWDGYRFERERIYRWLQDDGQGNAVVLSGDVHIGLASELFLDPFADDPGDPVAVELVTTSLTSQNVDDKKGWPRDTESVPMEQAFVEALPHVKWTDWDGHGYVLIDLDRDRLRAEWWFVDEVIRPSDGEHMDAAFAVRHGVPRLIRSS
ncbi:MAG TPA: alkaline phosphatase D family protein [Actinomycetota bacterium]